MKGNKKKSFLQELVSIIFQLMIAIVITLTINSGVFALSIVSGSSMANTLSDQEKLCVDRLSYEFSEPKHGDIIVFLKGETINGFSGSVTNTIDDILMKLHGGVRTNRLVKRIIGLPGDEINIINNEVYRNNELLLETYSKGNTYANVISFPLTVPEGSVFVLGDNRENSNDSRAFGVVDFESIEGKIVLRIWPLSEIHYFDH